MKSTIEVTSSQSNAGSKSANYKNAVVESSVNAQEAFKKKLMMKAETENSNLW